MKIKLFTSSLGQSVPACGPVVLQEAREIVILISSETLQTLSKKTRWPRGIVSVGKLKSFVICNRYAGMNASRSK